MKVTLASLRNVLKPTGKMESDQFEISSRDQLVRQF